MNIQYQKFLNECMLEFVKKVLKRIQNENLYFNQLIYISYKTDNPLVTLPFKIKKSYPREITIVLQYQFEELMVENEGFFVTLSFDGTKEAIYIPFEALISFMDSTNGYSLIFNQQVKFCNNSQKEILRIKQQLQEEISQDTEGELSHNVIVLDKFRNSSKSKFPKPS